MEKCKPLGDAGTYTMTLADCVATLCYYRYIYIEPLTFAYKIRKEEIYSS